MSEQVQRKPATTFQDLIVWQKAHQLVLEVYRVTQLFPKNEQYGLTSQLRRAAVSIAANIAEGAGRKGCKEFGHFLSNSQGSASEVETQLLIANRLGYLEQSRYAELMSSLDEIGRMITGLSRHLRTKSL